MTEHTLTTSQIVIRTYARVSASANLAWRTVMPTREADVFQRFSKFLIVGGAGFALDFTTLWALLTFAALSPIPARVIAYLVAITFTYICNRAFTFGDRPRDRRFIWAAYAVASAVSAAVNLGVFVVALAAFEGWTQAPYLAMPIGIAAGLVVNYIAFNFVVFRARPD